MSVLEVLRLGAVLEVLLERVAAFEAVAHGRDGSGVDNGSLRVGHCGGLGDGLQ